MAQVKTREFKPASVKALADVQLQRSLTRVMSHFNDARRAAIQEMTPQRWEELREQGREIKRHTLENLDYYLGLLTQRVTEAGGVVHFASDAQEACDIVTELVRSEKVQLVTKGKSMVSEEIGLNHVLEAMNVEVVETDLGEYVIQLAEETPFHIIAPAMHKSKEEVAQLFMDKLGTPHLERIEEMAQAARLTLREKLLTPDMGITGVNFAIAETGTIAIVTNEGNGRFCTSAPRIHLALMGMEKVIPRLEDLAVFLRLLPRSATGQTLTSYVSFIGGPRHAQEEDGPEEFHLVIVDNGRSRLLADPELREVLYCIRCGACLNICPVYRKVGGHAYGWVYPGPIGAVVTPVMTGLPQAKDLPFASTLCGACREVCPVNINIPHMLLTLRNRVIEAPQPEQRNLSRRERLAVRAWYHLLKSA
ncbi:MAG: LutB/LldF family L-lactate oxidation iron-sulfur protein, partial [Dehalococcoidia bacterium]